jgi:hypothetical protein
MPTDDPESMWEVLGRMKFVIWFCPDRREHARNRDDNIPQGPTVEWRDGVAYCLEPGCGNTSIDKKEER